MARLFALFTLLVAAVATAAPLGNRAGLGSIKCNIDRFKIVTSLAATNLAVKQIDTSDNDTATAVGTAQTGLSSAADGIKTIALNIITGQTPSADARTQVQNGLNDAQTALTGINDSTASAAVASAQTKLAATIQDGNDVVADC
ncbi:hypothetical protein C8F04DRAFT_1119789 [Mycena alexandri]|uniref:Uncharacterized protein n=1 Tax=Mycena alexandri TaxID=1745969 RepID=A0AAD6SLF6_9AGAR|nr:hypothetical protein C8F04DRAFT_1119789 [Mycena alexandri]